MSGVVVADRLPGVDQVPNPRGTVWGIDPSTRRVAVGVIEPDDYPGHDEPRVHVHTLSMPTGHFAHRLAHGHANLLAWLPRVAARYGTPISVLVEEPMGATMSRVHPSSQRALGVLLSALSATLPRTEIDLCVPGTWKARSVGHGRASKTDVMNWAISSCGYGGDLQDEADALGIAWAAALPLATA